MRDSEEISKVKKEITSLEVELNESSAQLGSVFYGSDIKLEDSTIKNEIDDLEVKIPEIKNKMETLKSYNLSITEAEEGLKVCIEKIKELKSGMGSILEKVGVELYCFIGEKELNYTTLNGIYREIKDGELKSETLENRLFSFENSAAKKSVLNLFSTPFKVRTIKKDIRQNNKDSLAKFRELGSAYTQIPNLIDEESNESILDVLEDYKKLNKSVNDQTKKQESLKKRIDENEQKIKEGSNGVRLKTLYTTLEQQIIDIQNKITEKFVVLGSQVACLPNKDIKESDVMEKYLAFKDKESFLENKKRELIFLEKKHGYDTLVQEIEERGNSIKIEEEHISLRIKALDSHKDELKVIEKDCEDMAKWLKDNPL